MTLDDFRSLAWAGFIEWAIQEPHMRRLYIAAVGRDIHTPEEIGAFTKWVTVEHWGLDEAPESYRAALAAAELTTPHSGAGE